MPPEIEVVASPSKAILGRSATLFCNVVRTNPGIVGAYVWRKETAGEQIVERSSTLLLNISTITDYDTYSCTVTNSAGETGTGNVTVTRQTGSGKVFRVFQGEQDLEGPFVPPPPPEICLLLLNICG